MSERAFEVLEELLLKLAVLGSGDPCRYCGGVLGIDAHGEGCPWLMIEGLLAPFKK